MQAYSITTIGNRFLTKISKIMRIIRIKEETRMHPFFVVNSYLGWNVNATRAKQITEIIPTPRRRV